MNRVTSGSTSAARIERSLAKTAAWLIAMAVGDDWALTGELVVRKQNESQFLLVAGATRILLTAADAAAVIGSASSWQ